MSIAFDQQISQECRKNHHSIVSIYILNKNTLGVKKVRGQSEAALQIGMCDQKL